MVVDVPLGQDIADFLGQGDKATVVALAGEQVRIVTAMARSYTRGNGFADFDLVTDDLAAVITTATARLVENPTQERSYALGAETTAHTPFQGWSLAETFVLNRYRKRAL